ncbi:hypothetical protein M440DRAFT_1070379 [Trichoderma longibrachiatum ATCC 18648]|uniref:Uncharacterized protein n=1 Tax=Trichoderma longibrachiatum ATCC 18648 TaxID=983965 RepID=A0A2T4BUL6_TRILO|nr:hypothetical protein M440DRAFT_1070379 [Trichoderma longibrachiatum ATCC 18648]
MRLPSAPITITLVLLHAASRQVAPTGVNSEQTGSKFQGSVHIQAILFFMKYCTEQKCCKACKSCRANSPNSHPSKAAQHPKL